MGVCKWTTGLCGRISHFGSNQKLYSYRNQFQIDVCFTLLCYKESCFSTTLCSTEACMCIFSIVGNRSVSTNSVTLLLSKAEPPPPPECELAGLCFTSEDQSTQQEKATTMRQKSHTQWGTGRNVVPKVKTKMIAKMLPIFLKQEKNPSLLDNWVKLTVILKIMKWKSTTY